MCSGYVGENKSLSRPKSIPDVNIEWIIPKWDVRLWSVLICLSTVSRSELCADGNGFPKWRKFL
jgi:hypothetical protein